MVQVVQTCVVNAMTNLATIHALQLVNACVSPVGREIIVQLHAVLPDVMNNMDTAISQMNAFVNPDGKERFVMNVNHIRVACTVLARNRGNVFATKDGAVYSVTKI